MNNKDTKKENNVPVFILEKGSTAYFQFDGNNKLPAFKAEHKECITNGKNGFGKFFSNNNSKIDVTPLLTPNEEKGFEENDYCFTLNSSSCVVIGGVETNGENQKFIPGVRLYPTQNDGLWASKESAKDIKELADENAYYINNAEENTLFEQEDLEQ